MSGSSFRVGDTRHLGLYEEGGECQEVQYPITVSFIPLPEALDYAPITAAEELKAGAAALLTLCSAWNILLPLLMCQFFNRFLLGLYEKVWQQHQIVASQGEGVVPSLVTDTT